MEGTILTVFLVVFVAKTGVATAQNQTAVVATQGSSNSSVNGIAQNQPVPVVPQGSSNLSVNVQNQPVVVAPQAPSNSSVNGIGGSGEKTNTPTSPTTKTTTGTEDPVVNINNLIEQIPNLCTPSVANKSCNSIVTQIRNTTNKADKCSFTESLQTCVDANCPKIPDVDKNVNAMKKICNGANLISVSTMLICSLAVVFWFTQG